MEPTLETFRERVRDLSARFSRHSDRYRGPAYNEETARAEFISPFFESLGWDLANRSGHAFQYRDVVLEEGIRVGDATKAPDYTFRIGGQRKFFVEAKKPGVDLKLDPGPAYQLRRYAWSAKLPLSVLTDFEELAVYDTRIRPKENDKASVARVLYLRHEEFEQQAERIWGIFAKRAVLEGSFDSYVDDNLRKRGTSEVDAEFLREIESWRELLAKNIALRNTGLTVEELNYAVQATIDRILFLRIAEGRGAELYGRLLGLTNGTAIYQRLTALYREADERYNSGIFDFKADRLSLSLRIDDKALRSILLHLYYPESPYEFSVLPAEILGNVYEQFLGKVIRLTPGGKAKVEEKPEVKKAGGVFYTPSYVVEYIVEQTLGKLTVGKSPRELLKLRVLDPACGSGSFLLAAYQKLLDAHLSWYRANEPKKHRNAVFHGPDGDWRLTTSEKRKILLSCIYGVDIDRQAVEVSKLALLLKCLEGETVESIRQLNLYGERALPSLERNIQCGNSLVSPQLLIQRGMGLFDDEDELRRLNPFDWSKSFPAAFKYGGFDAVVGNPPYLKIEHIDATDRELLAAQFRSLQKRFDAYGLFLELAARLTRESGLFGFIVPSTILNNQSFSLLRKLLLTETRIVQIVNLGGRVFKSANNDTLIIIASPGKTKKQTTAIYEIPVYGRKLSEVEHLGTANLAGLATPPEFHFHLRSTGPAGDLLAKLAKSSLSVGSVVECFQGFVTGGNEAYIVTSQEVRRERLESGVCKPAVFGDEIGRYTKPKQEHFVIYLTRESDLREFPGIERRLLPFKEKLARKREVQLGRQPWYALHWPRDRAKFEAPAKILVQAIRNLSLQRRIVATMDRNRLYADHTLNVLIPRGGPVDLRVVLGILNSSLMNYWFVKRHIDINIKGVYLEGAPLPSSTLAEFFDSPTAKRIAEAVEQRMVASDRKDMAKTPDEKERAVRREEALDSEIDRLVFELYRLSDSEIKEVEIGSRGST